MHTPSLPPPLHPLFSSSSPPPPSLSSSQWYAPVFSAPPPPPSTVSLSSLHTGARHWFYAEPYMHVCVAWVLGPWERSVLVCLCLCVCVCVCVCISVWVDLHVCAREHLWSILCMEEHVCRVRTVWGCVVGRWCCDRRSFRCSIIVLSASPLPAIWLSCEGKKHPAGMSTSPGATDGSQRNSCKWLFFFFCGLGVVISVFLYVNCLLCSA